MERNQRWTRRKVLQVGAGGLLAAGLWPGALRAEGSGNAGSFSFIQVNDLHYLSPECGQWLERCVRKMKAHQGVELCLLVGDLVDDGLREGMAAVRDIFQGLGVPTYVVVGNHDYLAQDDRKAYEELFPGRINYYFEHRGWQFVGLDTTEGQHYQDTRVPGPTLAWLEESLPKLDVERPTILFTHFPMGPGVKMRPLNADDVLAHFSRYNLQAVFCGHFHGFTERQVGKTILTTDKCCSLKRGNHDGTLEKGYFLCRAEGGKVSRTFIEVKQEG